MDNSAARLYDQIEMEAVCEEIDRLRMSNERLIAELGRIAEALGVGCSMREVLGMILILRASSPK